MKNKRLTDFEETREAVVENSVKNVPKFKRPKNKKNRWLE